MVNTHIVADYEGRKKYLLALICGYTPNDEDREVVLGLVEDLEEEKATQEYIIRSLTSWLLDGLFYNNWPWVEI